MERRPNFFPTLLAILLFSAPLSGRIVINELCYDPAGSDTGNEWIEIYNSGDADVNLAGALLLKGGSSFTLVYEFPSFVLRSRRYLLIGEANVTQAVLTAPLAFQNGGSETDGVRFVSPDGTYTDTVLYDFPNLNALPDDSGNPGSSFAPDAPEGYSLARRMDGLDTDLCADDWLAEANPTPGLPNRLYVDYALLHPEVWLELIAEVPTWKLGFWVKNLSSLSPTLDGQLSIQLDGVLVAGDAVPPLAAGDSLHYTYDLLGDDGANHQVQVSLELSGDTVPENNVLLLSFMPENLEPPRLNELLYDPLPGNPEWIEVFVATTPTRRNFRLRDAADNLVTFSLPPLPGHYVLCRSAAEMLAAHPQCPPGSIVEVSSWAALNNTGDSLWLMDSDDKLLDQMSYLGVSYQQGKSLERYQNSQNVVNWRYSLDASGSTPGRANSDTPPTPPFDGSLHLTGSPCKVSAGEVITLFYDLEGDQNRVNCRIYDRAGNRVRILADNTPATATGSLVWDGRDASGNFVPRGLYIILWESRPTGGKIYRRQLTAVINR